MTLPTSAEPKQAFIISRVWGSRHGGSIYSRALRDELAETGWEVTVLAERFEEPTEGGVMLESFFRRDARALARKAADMRKIFRLVTETPGSLVIVQGDLPRLTYLWLQRLVPLIFIRQDGILTCPGNDRFQASNRCVCERRFGLACLKMQRHGCLDGLSRFQQVGRLALRLRDNLLLGRIRHFVGNSRYIARVHRKPVQVLYPPRLDQPILTPLPPRNLHRLIFCGRLEPVKGAGDALRILSLLPERYHLEILGDGPERRRLVKRAEQLQLGNRVKFHGWVDASTRDHWLASAGALLMPSLWDEAFGMAGIEALAQGTPVVAYDVGGVSEWCRDGAGILVGSGQVGHAAAAVRTLTTDPDRWLQRSQVAKEVVDKAFPQGRFGRELAQLIAGVLRSHSARRSPAFRPSPAMKPTA